MDISQCDLDCFEICIVIKDIPCTFPRQVEVSMNIHGYKNLTRPQIMIKMILEELH